jgi:hypothetical protein
MLARIAAYLALSVPTDQAQWQLALLPLNLADFPITFIYWFIVPAPFGEMVIGPIWWFALPILIWNAANKWGRPKPE